MTGDSAPVLGEGVRDLNARKARATARVMEDIKKTRQAIQDYIDKKSTHNMGEPETYIDLLNEDLEKIKAGDEETIKHWENQIK